MANFIDFVTRAVNILPIYYIYENFPFLFYVYYSFKSFFETIVVDRMIICYSSWAPLFDIYFDFLLGAWYRSCFVIISCFLHFKNQKPCRNYFYFFSLSIIFQKCFKVRKQTFIFLIIDNIS